MYLTAWKVKETPMYLTAWKVKETMRVVYLLRRHNHWRSSLAERRYLRSVWR